MRLLSTLKSKQNQAPIKYKMWTSQFVHILGAWSKIQNVDEPIRPHPGCLVLPLLPDEPDVHV